MLIHVYIRVDGIYPYTCRHCIVHRHREMQSFYWAVPTTVARGGLGPINVADAPSC